MKRALIVSLLVLLIVAGCSGVIANAKYTKLITDTVAVSDEATTRAVAGAMSSAEMIQIIKLDNASWHHINNARIGVEK
jgi:uncharacterized protein YceK